jgi:hypothetical protein
MFVLGETGLARRKPSREGIDILQESRGIGTIVGSENDKYQRKSKPHHLQSTHSLLSSAEIASGREKEEVEGNKLHVTKLRMHIG